jgi:hypothetical protein
MWEGVEISSDAPEPVRDALRRIGRTEDVSFSPNNRRLALACFDRNSLAIVDVAITRAANRPLVRLTNVAEYAPPGTIAPHGVDFLDDETILVANRYGNVAAFRLPSNSDAGGHAELTPIYPPQGNEFEYLSQPGSLAIIRDEAAPVEVLICNNKSHTVTRHVLESDPLKVRSSDILLGRLLDYPDSVAVSNDNWLAISNHDAHVVMLYPWRSSLSEDSEPVCILRGVMYPHGLRFSADDQHLFVADAGRPHVHIYTRDGETWQGVQYPNASVRVMSDDIFELGLDPEGRGAKGVAIDNGGHVLAVTFENQPVAFFDIAAMFEHGAGRCPDQALQLSYELEALEQGRARREASIARLMGSTSFRITRPLRLLNAALSKNRR